MVTELSRPLPLLGAGSCADVQLWRKAQQTRVPQDDISFSTRCFAQASKWTAKGKSEQIATEQTHSQIFCPVLEPACASSSCNQTKGSGSQYSHSCAQNLCVNTVLVLQNLMLARGSLHVRTKAPSRSAQSFEMLERKRKYTAGSSSHEACENSSKSKGSALRMAHCSRHVLPFCISLGIHCNHVDPLNRG